jgi:putative tricarboxylic transport membrane protein
MEQLIAVAFGIVVGTAAGIIPGIGVLLSMVICTPVLMSMDIVSLLLFYMSVASMVQFTGTVPSVYLGIPGETNSLPAVIEGTKHTRRGEAALAIGVAALGSVVGSIVAVLVTWMLLGWLTEHMVVFFANDVKFYIYTMVIVFSIWAYNNKNFVANALLCVLGFALSLPGENDITPGFRYTFGIDDLKYGIPLMPVLIGFIVVPNLIKLKDVDAGVIANQKIVQFVTVCKCFLGKITSSIRGSIIGYFCGLVPGVTTVLSTNTSYSVEKHLHSSDSTRQLIASETANNSGQFASMLPLLLLGIPITGSEVVLYSLLVDAGWSPFQFNNIPENIQLIFQQIVPWFVFVNIMALLIAWPFAKHILSILRFNKTMMMIVLGLIVVFTNTYMGHLDYRTVAYTAYLVVFSVLGLALRRYELVPAIFMFILGGGIEAVYYRQFLL